MADHGAWPRAGARRPEPSWPTVIATTVRLWVGRHPVAGLKITGWRLLALVACAVLAVSAAIAAVAVGTTAASPARPSRRASAGQATGRLRRSRPRCRRRRRPGRRPPAGSPGRSAPARSWPATPRCAPRCRPAGSPRAGCWCSGTSASDPLGIRPGGRDPRPAQPVRRPPGERVRAGGDRQLRFRRRRGSTSARSPPTGPRPTTPPSRPTAAPGSRRASSSSATSASPCRRRRGRVLRAGRGRPPAARHAGRAGRPAAAADPRLRRPVAGRERRHPAAQRAAGPGQRPGRRRQRGCASMLSFLQAQRLPFLPTTAALVRPIRAERRVRRAKPARVAERELIRPRARLELRVGEGTHEIHAICPPDSPAGGVATVAARCSRRLGSPRRAAASAAAGTGWIRLAHLSPNTPAVDVYLYSFGDSSAQVVLHHVAYGTCPRTSRCPTGDYTVAMRAAGAVATSAPVLSASVDVGGRARLHGGRPRAGVRAAAAGSRRPADHAVRQGAGADHPGLAQAERGLGQLGRRPCWTAA